MAFYSIIYGILFFGAFSQAINFLITGDWTYFFMATIVCLIVFNDTIYTSHLIEESKGENKIEYKISMKLIDLLNYFILSFSIILMNVGKNIFGGWGDNTGIYYYMKEVFFWSLLVLYWLLSFLWNNLAGVYPKQPWHRKWVTQFMAAPMFINVILVYSIPSKNTYFWCALIVLVIQIIYLFFYKPLLSKLSNERTSNPNTNPPPLIVSPTK